MRLRDTAPQPDTRGRRALPSLIQSLFKDTVYSEVLESQQDFTFKTQRKNRLKGGYQVGHWHKMTKKSVYIYNNFRLMCRVRNIAERSVRMRENDKKVNYSLLFQRYGNPERQAKKEKRKKKKHEIWTQFFFH
ncbi:hypothetical protein NL108_017124 [Boleophthalmus pectinirostris]|nr:hypothetical protein NL108_017124 [Boleophthalmus pectinirostris]